MSWLFPRFLASALAMVTGALVTTMLTEAVVLL